MFCVFERSQIMTVYSLSKGLYVSLWGLENLLLRFRLKGIFFVSLNYVVVILSLPFTVVQKIVLSTHFFKYICEHKVAFFYNKPQA